MLFTIRPCREEDIQSITEIYAYYVIHTTYTFEITAPTVDEMKNRRADILSKNMPYLVAEDNGSVVGFAYCDWFRPRPAYRFTAEESIYLRQDMYGKGLGRQLLQALTDQAEQNGIRKLIAVIGDSTNERSVGLHRSLGFTQAGELKSGGWKFNRWLTVIFMEKNIGPGDTIPPE